MDIWHMTNGDAAVLLGMYRDRVFSGVMPCRFFGSSERGRPENTGRVQVAWDGLNFDVKRIEVYVPDVLSMDYLVARPALRDKHADLLSFTAALVAVSHERRHLDHYLIDIGIDHNIFVFSEYAAQSGNPSYYDQNYFSWFTDADAQYYGIRDAYKWIGDVFGKDSAVSDRKYVSIADEMILRYQSKRFDDLRPYNKDGTRGPRQDFVPAPASGDYGSVRELSKAYSKACRQLLHTRMEYDYNEGFARGDGFASFLCGEDGKLVNKAHYEVFQKTRDGLRQNLMVSCTNYALRKENAFARQMEKDGMTPETPVRDGLQSKFGVDFGFNRPFMSIPILQSIKMKAKEAVHDARNRDIDRRFGTILSSDDQASPGQRGPEEPEE